MLKKIRPVMAKNNNAKYTQALLRVKPSMTWWYKTFQSILNTKLKVSAIKPIVKTKATEMIHTFFLFKNFVLFFLSSIASIVLSYWLAASVLSMYRYIILLINHLIHLGRFRFYHHKPCDRNSAFILS
ncbi:hypothetical protein Barb6_03545 [Bacteroidales bacterium Barb6]|nr:hypothetical protein Barb6_03545 [Bacteroidales bacterium Barb6]